MRKVDGYESIDPNEALNNMQEWRESGFDDVAVGVRDMSGNLVGFGQLTYKGAGGVLGELMVDPEHQHLGIGKAIINSRMNTIMKLGLERVFMTSI